MTLLIKKSFRGLSGRWLMVVLDGNSLKLNCKQGPEFEWKRIQNTLHPKYGIFMQLL